MKELPNVRLTREAVKGYHRRRITRRCAKHYIGQDPQSDEGLLVQCGSLSVVQIQLKAGQIYDLCESCAIDLDVLESGCWRVSDVAVT